jgi:hypothetical protein
MRDSLRGSRPPSIRGIRPSSSGPPQGGTTTPPSSRAALTTCGFIRHEELPWVGLHYILADVLLYIVVAMGLTVSCLPRGTCCRCCPAFVSTTAAVLSDAEVVVVVVAIADVLALRLNALADEGFLLLAAALHVLLFLV